MNDRTIRVAPETILALLMALVGAYLLLLFLSAIRFVLVTFLSALILAQAIEPLVAVIERARLHRAVAVILAYVLILQFFLAIGALVLPPLVLQSQQLIANLPALFEQAQVLFGAYYAVFPMGFPEQFREAVNQIAANLAQLLPSFIVLPLRVGSAVVAMLMVIVISLYWLLVSHEVKKGILGLLPPEYRPEVEVILDEMAKRVGGWVRGQIILSSAIAIMAFIGLTALGVPYAVLLALWAGLTEIIPIVGPFIGAIPAVAVALLISPLKGLLVIILYIVIQQLENHLIVPNVMSREVGIQPLLVIFAILAGAEVMGIVGALLAVPVAAALQVIIIRAIRVWWMHRPSVHPPQR